MFWIPGKHGEILSEDNDYIINFDVVGPQLVCRFSKIGRTGSTQHPPQQSRGL
ncbi:MAG: hypothetical protein VX092_11765 [SAR324 cluster bacterium]|nr:hypothetical protein [SAR324 cluster bacterium]|tara:strand:+ start:1903 stop:2061 length:159 start_codon:yes stop_codon:yes gene_type:complete